MDDSDPAGTHLSVSPFLGLPSELLLRILECSPPSSLKQLRTSCKTLKTLADPLLWSIVYLYPHMDRFRQILSLSMHPPVRCHVRQLVYDLQWALVLEYIVRRIQSVWTAHTTPEAKQAALKRATDLKKGTMEPGRDDDIELLFLQDILRNLKSLESITVLENNANFALSNSVDLDLIPTFYQKLRESTCGSLPDSDLDPGLYCFRGSTRSTKRILVAAYSLEDTIKNLEIRNANWEHVTAFEQNGKHITLLRSFISGLTSLTLHGSYLGEIPPAFLMMNLGMVLSLASNLENLDLAFGITREDDPFSDVDWSTEDGNGSVSNTHSVVELLEKGANLADGLKRWGAGLKRLALSELRCSLSDLTKVFQRCAPTLKELELNYLDLLPESDGETKPCLVKLFQEIRSTLNLERIWLSRWFRNSGRQEWHLYPHTIYAAPPNTPPLLIEQVFQWILGAEHCPIEELAIKEGTTDITDEQLEIARRLTDNSFGIRTNWFPAEDTLSIASGLSAEYALASVGIDLSSPMPSDPPPGRPPYSPMLGPETDGDWHWPPPPSSPIYQSNSPIYEPETSNGDWDVQL